MHKKHCREFLGPLSEFLDGEASQQVCEQIAQQLAACPDCRIMVDTLRKTISLFQWKEASGSMPSATRQRLYHKLDLEEFLK